MDMKALGMHRIVFGVILLIELLEHIFHYTLTLSPRGYLTPSISILEANNEYFSLYNFIPESLYPFLLFITFLLSLGFIFGLTGFFGKFFLLFLYIQLFTRNLFVCDSGQQFMILMLFNCLCLPVEKALTLGKRTHKRKHVSMACFNVYIFIALIYFFNFWLKDGITWRNNTSVYYTLFLGMRSLPVALWMRTHIPFLILKDMSRSVLYVEALIPFLILSPFYTRITRVVSGLLEFTLHLGIFLTINLGTFAPCMMALPILLYPGKKICDELC